jgi:hypothetical protein
MNRPWVLRLYDQLRHLGYEVFMDQFVLTTSGGLNMQLEQHLERSAAAVMIWSSRSEESKWCADEYTALRTLEKAKRDFRYVVLRVDEVELPLMAQAKLWIDFSSQQIIGAQLRWLKFSSFAGDTLKPPRFMPPPWKMIRKHRPAATTTACCTTEHLPSPATSGRSN